MSARLAHLLLLERRRRPTQRVALARAVSAFVCSLNAAAAGVLPPRAAGATDRSDHVSARARRYRHGGDGCRAGAANRRGRAERLRARAALARHLDQTPEATEMNVQGLWRTHAADAPRDPRAILVVSRPGELVRSSPRVGLHGFKENALALE